MSKVKCEYAYKKGTNVPVHCKGAPQVIYDCPTCGNEMYVVPKKRVQTPHFRHFEHIDHEAKSIIHDNAKLFLLDHLHKLQEENKDIFIDYNCPLFHDHHTYIHIPLELPNELESQSPKLRPEIELFRYNLLHDIDDIEVEKQTIETFRPDISLMKNKKLHTAIEIVYSHEDTEKKSLATKKTK